ncbi:hypothetical protein SKAU_G00380000 [Synaphobranchus kaupii]|uniref:Uncharacterized protein n=1 Tax=Synaphobranchus kaupii TaxID=118154 RepID=A0A9Q1IDQ2_SYNKA|nr:hypothetical protein SKAU_G00380000 [Synaphobranchus kaupii]
MALDRQPVLFSHRGCSLLPLINPLYSASLCSRHGEKLFVDPPTHSRDHESPGNVAQESHLLLTSPPNRRKEGGSVYRVLKAASSIKGLHGIARSRRPHNKILFVIGPFIRKAKRNPSMGSGCRDQRLLTAFIPYFQG